MSKPRSKGIPRKVAGKNARRPAWMTKVLLDLLWHEKQASRSGSKERLIGKITKKGSG